MQPHPSNLSAKIPNVVKSGSNFGQLRPRSRELMPQPEAGSPTILLTRCKVAWEIGLGTALTTQANSEGYLSDAWRRTSSDLRLALSPTSTTANAVGHGSPLPADAHPRTSPTLNGCCCPSHVAERFQRHALQPLRCSPCHTSNGPTAPHRKLAPQH